MAEPVPIPAVSRSVIDCISQIVGAPPRSLPPDRAESSQSAEHLDLRSWLHDHTLQVLEYIANGHTDTTAPSSECRQLAASAARELRDRLARLTTDDAAQGLEDALRTAVSEAQLFAGHEIELVIGPLDGSVAASDAVALAAAAAESLTNVRKHARASHVVVYCEEGDGRAVVTIKDDGAGFDPAATSAGLGVRESLAERLARRGGAARVDSEPGRGTLVTLTLPAIREPVR